MPLYNEDGSINIVFVESVDSTKPGLYTPEGFLKVVVVE